MRSQHRPWAASVCLAFLLSSGTAAHVGAQADPWAIADQFAIAAGESVTVEIRVLGAQEGCWCLEMSARLHAATFAGSSVALRATLNGRPLTETRLSNKPAVFATAGATLLAWGDGDRWRVVLSPDFSIERNETAGPHRILAGDPYRFRLRVEDLLRTEKNTLTLRNVLPAGAILMVAGITVSPCARADVDPAAPERRVLSASAPADSTHPRAVWTSGGALRIVAGDQTFVVETAVSIPRGGWRRLGTAHAGWRRVASSRGAVIATARDVSLRRTFRVSGPFVEWHDSFRNRTGTPLGLIVRYWVPVKTRTCPVRLGHVLAPDLPRALERYEPQAPVAAATFDGVTVGLIPAKDALWVQASTYRDSLGFGLTDGSLCIAPGDSVELAVRALITPTEDYETWIDAARAALNANATVQGGFAFGTFAMNRWPPEKLRNWIRVRGLHFLSTPAPTSSGGHGLHGPALLASPTAREQMRAFAAAVHHAVPGVAVLAYFHSYLVNSSAVSPGYESTRMIASNRLPLFYPRPAAPTEFPLFVPIEGSAFAADLERVLATLWELGFDGVYWDEMAYSYRPWTYGEPWDRVSGDVAHDSHLLLQRKSSVPLLTQPWIERQIQDLTTKGKVVVANTQPVTMTMYGYHFPRFVETANSLALASTRLFSPIGLGDRTRERTPADVAERIRVQLDWGTLYYYYAPAVDIDVPNLTAYMFPFTPLAIRPGTLLGQERILTSRSGRFGWGDRSVHEVHMFDALGREIEADFRSADSSGARWTDIELQPGGTAAIIRKAP